MNQPRPLLGGRYSLERPLLSSLGERRWMAIEAASGKLVVVAIADPGRLSTLEPARAVRHRHLATLTDVLKEVEPYAFPPTVALPAGAGAIVAEHVPGKTLRAVLANGPLHPAKAVAWVLRLAEAVQVLHTAGAVHGAISPRSVIAEPEGRSMAPVMSQLIAPPVGAFCPPERLRGAAESASDDVWALCATLYAALTGKAPFVATARDALTRVMQGKLTPLAAAGVNDPALQEIVARGLVPDRRQRAIDLAEFQSVLDGWEREPTRMPPPRPPPRPAPRGLGEIVGGGAVFEKLREDEIVIDDSSLPDDQGSGLEAPHSAEEPAAFETASPLAGLAPPEGLRPIIAAAAAAAAAPAAPARPPSRRVSFNPFERKQMIWPWLLVAAVVGGGGVYLTLAPRSDQSKPKEEAVAVDSDERKVVQRPAAAKRSADLVRNECVAEHFPPKSFEGVPDFAFVCGDGDFSGIARQLSGMVVIPEAESSGDAGVGTAQDAGMRMQVVRGSTRRDPDAGLRADAGVRTFALEWYELPATAIIRKTCCPSAAPVILPETQGWCEQLQSVVRRMADDSAKSVDLAPGARAFDKAVGCLYANRVRHGYTYSGPPNGGSRSLFQQFLSRAAIIGARR